MKRPGGLWRQPDFVYLWAGETTSIFGTLVGNTALLFAAILWLDAGPLAVAVLAACQMAPGFLFGMLAGVWVDRLPRRPLMVACDLARFALLMTVPAAALVDALTIWHLFAVAFVRTTLDTFFETAHQAYLPSLVGAEHLVEGNSKLAASAAVAEVAGFGIAGWLVQGLTAPGAVLVDALTFLVSALFIGRIGAPEPSPGHGEDGASAWREAREGVKAVTESPVLSALATTLLLFRLPTAMFGAVFVLFVTRELEVVPGIQGSIWAIGGITSLFGAVLAGRSGRVHFGRAMAAAAALRSLGMVPIAAATGPMPVKVGILASNQLLTDPAWTYYEIQEVSLRQASAPNAVLGRVAATFRVVEFGAALAGMLAGGILGEAIGLRPTIAVAVAGAGGAAAYFALSPAARLRRLPRPVHRAGPGET